MGDLETMTVAQTHHVGCKHHLETAHSLDSTAACFIENLKVSVLQLPSVLRLEDATELQFPCTVGHDYVKILKLVLKNQSVPKMA